MRARVFQWPDMAWHFDLGSDDWRTIEHCGNDHAAWREAFDAACAELRAYAEEEADV